MQLLVLVCTSNSLISAPSSGECGGNDARNRSLFFLFILSQVFSTPCGMHLRLAATQRAQESISQSQFPFCSASQSHVSVFQPHNSCPYNSTAHCWTVSQAKRYTSPPIYHIQMYCRHLSFLQPMAPSLPMEDFLLVPINRQSSSTWGGRSPVCSAV